MTPALSLTALFLVKWTLLLALGWAAHRMLLQRHCRWRLILWRGILCLSLGVPLMQFAPVLHVPIFALSEPPAQINFIPAPTAVAAQPSVNNVSATPPLSKPGLPIPSGNPTNAAPSHFAADSLSWENAFLTLWILGVALLGCRLIRLQIQLSRILRQSKPASCELQRQARKIQVELGVSQTIDLRISDATTSPFACGLLRPVIVLPQTLARDLASDETDALFAHEIAHFKGRDLFWTLGWRGMQTLFWFHPLVWKAPAAHSLACEQEADRLASSRLKNEADYSQLLARLALRVLALPSVETRLVLNGTSQIAQRLAHLQDKARLWTWKHSVAGFGLAGLLFFVATGCDFSSSASFKDASGVEFKTVAVLVQDEEGKPVSDAVIVPNGLRIKEMRASFYRWISKPEKIVTGPDGTALIKYPVLGVPAEKQRTVAISFSVDHPGFCQAQPTDFSVNGKNNPVRLIRSGSLRVSAYYGPERQPVREFVPTLYQRGATLNDWLHDENGVMEFNKVTPGNHTVQLMGRLPSGEIVFSDGVVFTAKTGTPNVFALELKPGIRLEGRLDNKVPRPVKNGQVLISVRLKQISAYLPEDVDNIITNIGDFTP
jgi:beta-lactamase regulating signal transducer with metallopeptidase domain